MKLPNKVRIMGVDWTIEEHTDAELSERAKYGETIHGLKLIKVDIKTHPSKVRETLLHELIHAVTESMTDQDTCLSEFQVRVTANGLRQIFADNPWVLKYLAESRESGQRSK